MELQTLYTLTPQQLIGIVAACGAFWFLAKSLGPLFLACVCAAAAFWCLGQSFHAVVDPLVQAVYNVQYALHL